MDNKKTGDFIAKKRAEKGLSQKELAEMISVTDKAVSKWETGRGFPDVSLLPALSKALGVTVTELVNGEETNESTEKESADSAVMSALRYSKKMSRKVLGVIFIIAGAVLAISPMYIVGRTLLTGGASVILGAVIAAAGIFTLVGKIPSGLVSRRSSAITAAVLSLCAVIAEIPKHAIAMEFAAPTGETLNVVMCSYFDMLPFGYGTLTPLVTAVLSVALAVMGVLALFIKNKKGLTNACFVLGIITCVFSVLHIPFFTGILTAQSATVTLLLALSVVMRAFSAAEK